MAMDAKLRMRLADDFLPRYAVDRAVCDLRPVQCSVDLVESACIDTPPLNGKPAKLAVPLMNYTGKPAG